MMTLKIKRLIAINLVLLAAIGASVALRNRDVSTLSYDTSPFAIADTSMIDRVTIGQQELVRKSATRWVLNGDKEANPGRVRSLLTLLNRVEIKRPVPSSLAGAAADSLEQIGVQVVAFAGDQPLKTMQLGRIEGETVARLNDNPDLFALYIQGYNVDLYQFFSNNESDWRDPRALYTTPRTLQRLEVFYPRSPQNSFRIVSDSLFFTVEGVQQLDNEKLEAYLLQYQAFVVKGFLGRPPQIEEMAAKMQPFCIIDVADILPEQTNRLTVFLFPKEQFFGYSEANGGEWVEIDREVLASFLVARGEFESR